MKIHTLHLGELRANCYIIETAPNQCVAVDIGGDSRLFLEYIKMRSLTLTKIFLTHGHFDHIGGCEAVRKATGAEIYIHEDDAPMLTSENISLASSMSYYAFNPVSEWTVVRDNCFITDGELTFKVMHTPGHSKGSVCYICEDVIFSGDTLFCCYAGRTDFPGSNPNSMMQSLQKLYELDGDYRVYPGHEETTTLQYERESNPFMRKFRG